MRLLILTQKVDMNDDVLGFMHDWLREFARQCEMVTVICLERGEYDLPRNARVFSLGKENGGCRLKYLFNFYKYIWRERDNYDAVFVHMNPEYIILGGFFWRLWKKKIWLWYAHGYVSWSLRIAEKLSDAIFTSTRSGCRLSSPKIKVIGQGIDTDKFQISDSKFLRKDKIFKIITVGRISPSKDYETLIGAAERLRERGLNFKIDIVGGAGLAEQESYFAGLKNLVSEKKLQSFVVFAGSMPNGQILPLLQEADLFVNMGQTGSLDKAVLEAMSAGLPILTCNEAFTEVLGKYAEDLMYPKKDYVRLAEKIEKMAVMSAEERRALGFEMREIIVRDHSLRAFVAKILK